MRTKNKECTMEEITFIEQHLNEMSNKELAHALGVSENHIHGIFAYYKLRRNAKGLKRVNERRGATSASLHAQECERVRQGLPQLTKLKLNKKFLAMYQKV